jgi:hypothetical protein
MSWATAGLAALTVSTDSPDVPAAIAPVILVVEDALARRASVRYGGDVEGAGLAGFQLCANDLGGRSQAGDGDGDLVRVQVQLWQDKGDQHHRQDGCHQRDRAGQTAPG